MEAKQGMFARFLGWKNSVGTVIAGTQPPEPLYVMLDDPSSVYPYTSLCGRYCFRESELIIIPDTPFNESDWL